MTLRAVSDEAEAEPGEVASGPSLADRALSLRIGRRGALLAGGIALAVLLGLVLLFGESRPPVTIAQPARPAAVLAPPPAIGPLLAAVAARLSAGATLHAIARDAGGGLTLEVDTPEPDALRTALAADPRFAALRTTGEAMIDEGGMRVTLAIPSAPSAAPAGPAPDLAAITAAARTSRLLPEQARAAGGGLDLAVSGAEADLIGFVAALEHRRPPLRFPVWRIEQAPGGVRLTGRAIVAPRASAPAAADPGRALFAADAAPADPDAPALVGIVGRLPDDAIAMVRTADGRTLSLAPGEAASGWTLAALSHDAALFTRGAERLRVPLPLADDEAEDAALSGDGPD